MSTTHATFVEPLESRAYYAVITPQVKVDVAITEISRSTIESLSVGSKDFGQFTLTNLGTAKAQGNVRYRLYASADNKLDANDRLLLDSIRSINIAPHASTTTRFNFNYATTITPRSYRMIGTIAPSFGDAKTSNNRLVSPTIFKLTPILGNVDYSISLSDVKMNYPYGVRNPVTATVRNLGTVESSKPIAVGLYASPDNIFGNGNDIYLAGTTITPRLKPKASTSVDLAFTSPSSMNAGNYYVIASVDTFNTVKELNETNNRFVTGFAVKF